MGSYLGYILTAFVATPAHEPEVRVDSQSDIACCTTSTVVYDDSDEEMPWQLKKQNTQVNDNNPVR